MSYPLDVTQLVSQSGLQPKYFFRIYNREGYFVGANKEYLRSLSFQFEGIVEVFFQMFSLFFND